MSRAPVLFALTLLGWLFCQRAPGRILWADPTARTVHNTGAGADILGGAVRRTGTNNDALFF